MALTRSQLMRIKQNRKYWRDREIAQRAEYIRTEDEELREIQNIYDGMYRWAEREINAFYGKYADAEGIDITEAKRRVSNLDVKEFEQFAKEYVKDKDFSDKANAELRLYNATMKINRLELLKAQIGLKLVDGINDVDKHWEKIATDRATQEIIRQSGILGETLTKTETAKTAKQVVNADFYNANFSERIWMHMDNLKSELSIELQKGFIAGIGSQKMATNLRKKFDVSRRDADRLARTELRRIQTDVAKDNYERNGIGEYEYMAVNPSACPICRELDGKIFKVADMNAGENAPPLHPNCHCTTAPHFDDAEYEQWLSWLENGGTTEQWDNMSLAERQSWYDNLIQSIPKNDTTEAPAETFTPAKTKAEAEEYARRFADNVDYSGVSLANANIINKQLSVLTAKHPINKLNSIGTKGKGVMSASYRTLTINGKKLGKTLAEEQTNFELNKAMDRATIKQIEERWAGKQMPFAIESDLNKLKDRQKFKRWGVHSEYEDHVKCVLTHEYGHILSDQYFGMINKERANPNYSTPWDARLRDMDQRWKDAYARAKKDGDIYDISQYASTKPSEFFAECFAKREMGGKLPKYIEDLMAEVLDNGIM